MPTFRSELPMEKKHMGFDLRRTPIDRPLQAIVTCDQMIVCDTHYWGGRTVPCERRSIDAEGKETAGDCKPCGLAIPYRTHVYVSAFDANIREHFIFECTAAASKAFEEYYAKNGTLRGCVFRARRPKGKTSSRVAIETNTVNLCKVQLPEAPFVIAVLCMIWHIPMQAEDRVAGYVAQKEAMTRADRVKAMREQMSNAPETVSLGDVIADVIKFGGAERPKQAS